MKSFVQISLISAVFQGGYAKPDPTSCKAPFQGSYVKGSYIVTLKPSTKGDVLQDHLKEVRKLFDSEKYSNEIKHEYGKALLGYSAKFTDDVLAKVEAMPEVKAVEKDQLIEPAEIQTKSWGLARLSSKDKLVKSESYSYNYDPSGGEGVDVYVIDSGIKTDHPEFEGRARWGENFIDKENIDDGGHGTHVAGIIGSKTYGVAKKSTLIAVKVNDAKNSGSVDSAIAGIDWVLKNLNNKNGCVINLSLSADYSEAFSNVLRAAVNVGCVVTASAGNKDQDICSILPACDPYVITVGASTFDDLRASFSNWGKCLNVFAPGKDIISTSNDGKTQVKSGTSMAAAYVAGLAANFMSKTGMRQPDYFAKYVKEHSNSNVLKKVEVGSPNLLASNIDLLKLKEPEAN
ncbi:proteinase B [Entomophthora muscae]|uniref:Proteinase B n=1 Tax=Entomophthora muscae TaxID=34485 RepID=A0ACC2ULR0_9FUNG|nr:proteinase B [Entomophthora muscae]